MKYYLNFKGSLGDFIRQHRKARKINTVDLSKNVGKSTAYVSQIENGYNRKPDYDKLFEIFKLIGIDENKIEDYLDHFGVLSPEREQEIIDRQINQYEVNEDEYEQFKKSEKIIRNQQSYGCEYYVYRFLDSEGSVIYVGKTGVGIKQRMKQHFRNGHLPASCYKSVNRIEYVECYSKVDMNIKEVYYINKWNPDYNTRDNNREELMSVKINERFDNWLEFADSGETLIENLESKVAHFQKMISSMQSEIDQKDSIILEITKERDRYKDICNSYDDKWSKMQNILNKDSDFLKQPL